MRATFGAGLLLASSMLVAVSATPAEADTGCDAPTTTWVGPTPDGGSVSWADSSNWSNGVPTAASVVCIPATTSGPQVLAGTAAEAGAVTLEGTLTVAGSLDVATFEGVDFGELHGPGTTTIRESITGGSLTLLGDAVVDLPPYSTTSLSGEIQVYDGSRLNAHGDLVLASGSTIDSFGQPGAGLFTVTDTGSLTLDPNAYADVIGGFANHGEITVTSGWLEVVGAGVPPMDGALPQFSDGRFAAAPGAHLDLSYTELHDGAHLEGVMVDNIAVPRGSTVTVADSDMLNGHQTDTAPSIHGEGDLVLTDGTVVDGPRFGDSLTVTVPAEEVVTLRYSSFQDQARLQVYGELLQDDGLSLQSDARLDVYGVHRAVSGTAVESRGADPGLEIIHPGGQLLADEDAGLIMDTPFVNRGTVDSGSGFFFVAPGVESPDSSSGTFRAGTAGTLGLGLPDGPQFALDQAIVEGEVDVYGTVRANALQVRGHLSIAPGGATWPPGQLELTGTTTLANGASIAGDVLVGGQLEADLGATGTATLSGAEVTGSVRAVSGTLSIPSLAATTLQDGTLTSGEWLAAPGATLDLPSITTNQAELTLQGAGASFGELTALGNGPNGTVDLIGGADLEMPGRFRNEGVLRLSPGSRVTTGAGFRQFSTGRLVTEVDATGLGRVRTTGARDLAGKLVVDRDPTYKPPVGTVLPFITSAGATSPDDAFDSVTSPRYGTHKQLRPAYDTNHVRLRVDRVG